MLLPTTPSSGVPLSSMHGEPIPASEFLPQFFEGLKAVMNAEEAIILGTPLDLGETIAHMSEDNVKRRSPRGQWRIDVADLPSSTMTRIVPELFWPQRSIQRQHRFQSLLRRFNKQLMRGCSEPQCGTPACLSFQKGTSKGPFRPYTALSARALATCLASQDHPEEYLCPHLLEDSTEATNSTSQSRSGDWDVNEKPPDQPNGDWPTLKESVSDPREPTEEVVPPTARKDHKSFAQNVFETFSMKQLASQDLSLVHFSEPQTLKPSTDAPISVVYGHEKMISPQLEAHSPTICSLAAARAGEYSRFTREECIQTDQECERRRTQSGLTNLAKLKYGGNVDMISDEEQALVQQQAKAAHSQLMDEMNEIFREYRLAEEELLYRRQHRAWTKMQSSGSKRIGTEERTASKPFDAESLSSASSLPYFSRENVLRVWLAAREADDLEDVRNMLRAFGRPISSFNPSRPVAQGPDLFARYIALLHRSTSYICMSRHALLRSFIEWKQDEDASITARSNPLGQIVKTLWWTHSLDDPSIMLSSLWSSAEMVYAKREDPAANLRDDESTCAAGLNETFTDVEAAHLAKIVLAALISIVPLDVDKVDDETLNAVMSLRQLGHVSPSPGIILKSSMDKLADGNSRLLLRSYAGVLNIIDCFENLAASSLAIRLVKGMASRHWLTEQANHKHSDPADPKVDGSNQPGFMSLVMRNIADGEGVQVKVHDTDYPPSLEDGRLEDFTERRIFRGQDVGLEGKGMYLLVEWMRTIILKEWDGKPEVPRCGAVGGALEFMKHMYLHCSPTDLRPECFQWRYLFDRLDIVDLPVQWAKGTTHPKMVHILSYPFVFPPYALVNYFRAINLNAMTEAFQASSVNQDILKQMCFARNQDPRGRGAIRLHERLYTSLSRYLVLDVRREHILEDAMSQLWRREPHELMKPLKVRMGMKEGEEGVDLGGVQQEFFRLAIAEAVDPKYGAFTTDATTRMSWFKPFSLEPLHMFEMVGLLISLAIYNGLTLPFTFPRALYRKIAGLPCESIEDIRDGWPEVAKGLQQLLDWTDGDVEDVFSLSYTFSVDAFGLALETDMGIGREDHLQQQMHAENSLNSKPRSGNAKSNERTYPPKARNVVNYALVDLLNSQSRTSKSTSQPTSPAMEDTTCNDSSRQSFDADARRSSDTTIMVTNANRHQYVRDYVFHLTDNSIRPEFDAFRAGFCRCLSDKARQLFTEDSLKELIEGQTIIDTHKLQEITKYDADSGFYATHPTILQFWEVLHEWGDPQRGGAEGQEKVRKLLEFVTASDRLPVGGVERLMFTIQRNGEGDERLPTSMTCFGRLLLPEFSGIDALRTGLERAVQESRGFGLQ